MNIFHNWWKINTMIARVPNLCTMKPYATLI